MCINLFQIYYAFPSIDSQMKLKSLPQLFSVKCLMNPLNLLKWNLRSPLHPKELPLSLVSFCSISFQMTAGVIQLCISEILSCILLIGRVSKFRHLKGNPGHKSTHIENIRNISRQISGECDGFHANRERVAVPLSGPGGRIAVLELSRVGKLPDGVIPALVHGANVMDFAWDPFNCSRLAVGKNSVKRKKKS